MRSLINSHSACLPAFARLAGGCLRNAEWLMINDLISNKTCKYPSRRNGVNPMKKLISAAAIGAAFAASSAFADVDPDLPEYHPVSGVSGSLSSIGSDTLNNLMTLWAEEFQDYYPRSEEHTSELQSRGHLVWRLLLEEKKKNLDNATRVESQELH